MVPGPFQLMRKHWKKSIFFWAVSTTSLAYAYDYSVTNSTMKMSCRKAAALGDKRLASSAQPRHITVILNPVAGKRKSKKLYTKWVEPLLHLAGIKVSLVETERPNQAYDLMKIMSNCDGIAVVGGDGTVHEVLNGLLHRQDCSKAVNEFPIGLIPTGMYNSIARYIHQGIEYRNQKELLIQSTLKLVESYTEKHDVLKILPLTQDDEKVEPPIYALRDVRYGKYQDNFVKVSGYLYYQTTIRPFILRLQKIFKNNCPMPEIESITYTKPCKGCSKCFNRHLLKGSQPPTNEVQSTNSRWWSMLAPVAKPALSDEEKRELELSSLDNPDCDRWLRVDFVNEVTDFRACMMGDKKVRLSIARHGEYNLSDILETQDVRLKVSEKLDNEKRSVDEEKLKESVANDTSQDTEVKETKNKVDGDRTTDFLIDGQPVQAHSLEISTLSKPVTIFTGRSKHISKST